MKENAKNEIIVTVNIMKYPDVPGYTGFVEQVPGIVAYGETAEKVKEELLLSLKMKVAYDNQIPIIKMDDLISITIKP